MTAYSTPLQTASANNTLFSERLASYSNSDTELVLLSGWSMDSSIWYSLLPQLRQRCHVTLVDLPGTGRSAPGSWNPVDLLEAVLAVVPERAIYLGWSLGGGLALHIAHTQPARVEAALCLGTNPRFVASEDWSSAMPAADFASFSARVSAKDTGALPRFDWLQSGGDKQWQNRCRRLRQDTTQPAQLQASLELLARLDLRAALPQLTMPIAHLLGEQDQLVPASLASSLAELAPSQQVELVPAAGHLLPLCAEVQVLAALDELLLATGGVSKPVVASRNKVAVASSFGAAAQSYNAVATLQQQVGGELLQLAPDDSPVRLLDLGCGTGYFKAALQGRYPGADYCGLDLAEGMVRYAAATTGAEVGWLVGDAEDLPLQTRSVDLVFSSLALQWCESIASLAAELFRVLSPGGHCLIATLGPQTLHELRASWSAVDSYQHVNEFLPAEAFVGALEASGLQLQQLQTECVSLQYDTALELLRELKSLGAHNLNASRPAGMTGRQRLQAFQHAYEHYRQDGKLPATYEVQLLLLRRPL